MNSARVSSPASETFYFFFFFFKRKEKITKRKIFDDNFELRNEETSLRNSFSFLPPRCSPRRDRPPDIPGYPSDFYSARKPARRTVECPGSRVSGRGARNRRRAGPTRGTPGLAIPAAVGISAIRCPRRSFATHPLDFGQRRPQPTSDDPEATPKAPGTRSRNAADSLDTKQNDLILFN